VIYGGSGADRMFGGDGNDLLVARDGAATDIVDGGAGIDRALIDRGFFSDQHVGVEALL
jgi:Ca2+-binding RTX toxin-like protein